MRKKSNVGQASAEDIANGDMSGLLYPSQAIASLLVEYALGRARLRRLRRGGPVRLVIVADADRLDSVAHAIEDLGPSITRVVVSERPKRAGVTGDLSGLVGASGGIPAVHVCSDTAHVPAAFRAVAEATITIGPAYGALVRRAMRRCCTGRVPASISKLDLSAIPFKVLCACIARGSPASRAAIMLAAVSAGAPASESDSWLPDLEDCHEFGRARDWGLRVMRDIALWTVGGIPDRDLDCTALLVSEPGHGKTIMARVLAKSMGVPLLPLSMGDLFKGDGHLHSTIAAMRAVFDQAKACAPSVLFIDEMDSFPQRGNNDQNDAYFTALVNELLALVDGAAGGMAGVVLLAATNRPDSLDPALLRQGRFANVIRIERPDRRGIEHILHVHLRGDLPAAEVSALAALAMGATPAQIMGWVKTARSVARDGKRSVQAADVRRQILGNSGFTGADLRRVAIHEAGHAVVGHLLGHPFGTLDYVSTIPSDGDGGHAAMRGNQETHLNRARLEDGVVMLLAGRAAEELVLGSDVGAGAGGPEDSDLSMATGIVGSIYASLGLGGSLLWRSPPDHIHRILAADLGLRTVVDVRLSELYDRARILLSSQRHVLQVVTEALLERRVLSGGEVATLVGLIERRRTPPLQPASGDARVTAPHSKTASRQETT